MKKITLASIAEHYSTIDHNSSNYSIGGGISTDSFVSNRQIDAKNDPGKLTIGKATDLFKKATGCEKSFIQNVIEHNYDLEWHHSGSIPGRRMMGKTFFVNSKQIVSIAQSWEELAQKYNSYIAEKKEQIDQANNLQDRKNVFLKKNATRFDRKSSKPSHGLFVITDVEQKGKYGYFESNSKYNLPEYYSGWEFNDQIIFNEYQSIL